MKLGLNLSDKGLSVVFESHKALLTTLNPRSSKMSAQSGWGSTQTKSALGKLVRTRKQTPQCGAPIYDRVEVESPKVLQNRRVPMYYSR